ncbi:unnamed protein product [Tilletia caries]|nr:unnamed protein product [Tilletia caries]
MIGLKDLRYFGHAVVMCSAFLHGALETEAAFLRLLLKGRTVPSYSMQKSRFGHAIVPLRYQAPKLSALGRQVLPLDGRVSRTPSTSRRNWLVSSTPSPPTSPGSGRSRAGSSPGMFHVHSASHSPATTLASLGADSPISFRHWHSKVQPSIHADSPLSRFSDTQHTASVEETVSEPGQMIAIPHPPSHLAHPASPIGSPQFAPSLITRSSPGRPKLPRLDTGDKVPTLQRIQSSSNLPFQLGTPKVPDRGATDDGALETSRPSSRNRSGPPSPLNIQTERRDPAIDMLHPTSAYAPEFSANPIARRSNPSLRASAAGGGGGGGFCATTASIFAAASLASSSNSSSTASSPSSLRPPSDLSSSVGSNRTLSLSIKPPLLSPAPSRRPTLTLSPVAPVRSLSPPRTGPGNAKRVNTSPLSLSPTVPGATANTDNDDRPPAPAGLDQRQIFGEPSHHDHPSRARSYYSLREYALEDSDGARGEGGHRPYRPNSFSTVSPSGQRRRPNMRGITLDTAMYNRNASVSPSREFCSPSFSPMPSAMEIQSPWSVASAHCGGSPGTRALEEPDAVSSRDARWQGSTRSFGSSNRSAFVVPGHLDRSSRPFISSPSSSSTGEGEDDRYGVDSARRRKSTADYESWGAQQHASNVSPQQGSWASSSMFIPRRPPIATSSAPPALNPTPIIPSLLFLGPAPSHPAHWAELRALGVRRVLNVAEEVDLDVPTVHPGKGWRGGAGTAGEAEAEAEIMYKKVGIQDYVEEQRVEDMLRQGSEFLNESIDAQEPIYVHCLAGRSRSPTAIIAYLIRYRAWSFDRAYGFVRELRGGGAIAAFSSSGGDEGEQELVAVKVNEGVDQEGKDGEGGVVGMFTRSAPVSASVLEHGHETHVSGTIASSSSTSRETDRLHGSPSSSLSPPRDPPARSPSSPSLSSASSRPPPPEQASWAWSAASLSALAAHSYHATNFAPNIGFVAELRRWETLCEVERVEGRLPEPGRKVAISSAVIPSSTSGNKGEAEEEPVSAEREMSLSPVEMQAGLGGTGGGWSVMQNLRLPRLTVDSLDAHSQSAQVDADMTTSGPERSEDQLEELRTNVDKVTLRTDSSGSGLLPIDAAVGGGGSSGASSTADTGSTASVSRAGSGRWSLRSVRSNSLSSQDSCGGSVFSSSAFQAYHRGKSAAAAAEGVPSFSDFVIDGNEGGGGGGGNVDVLRSSEVPCPAVVLPRTTLAPGSATTAVDTVHSKNGAQPERVASRADRGENEEGPSSADTTAGSCGSATPVPSPTEPISVDRGGLAASLPSLLG